MIWMASGSLRFWGKKTPPPLFWIPSFSPSGWWSPGCFDAMPDHLGERGVAAYRTTVRLSVAGRHRLVFQGVNNWCRVFVNRQAIGEHSGGWTTFALESADFLVGENEIIALVDNRLAYDTSPLHLDYFDWYQYGGITRSVELHQVTNIMIEQLVIRTIDHAAKRIAVEIHCRGTSGGEDLLVWINGRLLHREALSINGSGGCIRREFELPEAELWSPERPRLQYIEVQLGDDDQCERFGLRTVVVAGHDILINGKPVKLMGFNRHESHPQFGCGSPDALLLSDLQLLRQMGCNFLRGSHYPQDPRLLDLCDEMGICVWQEALGWQHTTEHLMDPFFLKMARRHIGEMIDESINHPSIIIWGLLNESWCHDAAAKTGYAALINCARSHDSGRPVTYACSRPFEDICRDLIDVVAINTYPGWYNGITPHEGTPEWIAKVIRHVDENGGGNKPMIFSEIGAGAIYGCRETHGGPWTEQYQAQLLETVVDSLFRQTDRVCGLSIWQFCDCRSPYVFHQRPRGFNNKGVMDEYRRPKLAFDAVRRKFKEIVG